MIVREYQDTDKASIEALHRAMGLDYQMLDLDSPLVVGKTICEENGEVVAATALKIEAETYLWIKPDAPPALKWDAIRLVQKAIVAQAFRLGIEQLVAYIPDCLRFKRLASLGWKKQRSGWTPWSYEVTTKI